MDAREPNGGDRARPADDWSMLDRWEADEADPNFLSAMPEGLTRAQELKRLFPAVPPPVGRPERAEWDALHMDDEQLQGGGA